MEHNGLGGGIYSGMGSGILGLEMPLHQQPAPQNPQNPHQLQPRPQAAAYSGHEPDQHPQSQQSVKGYSYASTKQKQLSPLSDEYEPGLAGDDSPSDGKRKMSPWQRMKWTGSMVRLLIMAVFYIGDEAGAEGNDTIGKKKGGALIQKKGKWKSVSRAMMEKGFFVSPQQCEDKFNDLNKRYKRVNDILGKGTACKVVENQSLLDTMDLSPKMKEEVKKLLNSKHLFFREMCAYHNSCSHVSAVAASGSTYSPETATDQSHAQNPQATQQQHHKGSHSSQNVRAGAISRAETEGSKMAKRIHNEEDDEEDDDESDEEDDEVEKYEGAEGNSRRHNRHKQEYEDDCSEKFMRKRARKEEMFPSSSTSMQQFNGELTAVIQDGTRSPWEKKQWMKMRLLQLEEQQVSRQCEALELEKQRLKWIKFSSKKEREMEKAKLENERKRLENEKMVLLLRLKEQELHDLEYQQQLSSNKRSDPSSVTG